MEKNERIYSEIRVRITKARKSKNLSQEELAARSGVSRSHVGFIEQGRRRPTIQTLYKLARALEITLQEFFKGL